MVLGNLRFGHLDCEDDFDTKLRACTWKMKFWKVYDFMWKGKMWFLVEKGKFDFWKTLEKESFNLGKFWKKKVSILESFLLGKLRFRKVSFYESFDFISKNRGLDFVSYNKRLDFVS